MVTLTKKAEEQLKYLLGRKENENLGLRLYVSPGG